MDIKNKEKKSRLDRSWKALFNPGGGEQYFMKPAGETLLAGQDRFNMNNAWWLSEFSRATYRLDNEFRQTASVDEISKLLSPPWYYH